jgi:putative chitobiose transport system permease protein
LRKQFKYFLLIMTAGAALFPFIWLLSTSFKGAGEIFSYPPNLIPEEFVFENYTGIWEFLPFGFYFMNSIIVVVLTVLLNLLMASLAGFSLARFDFRGREFLFILVLASMMIPRELILIPLYSTILDLNLADTLAGVILPFAVEGFAIFLMRQAFLSIPKEIEEAAVMDGASYLRIWWKIMLPMTKPSLAVLAVFTFIGTWGDFLWPLIVLKDQQNFTLQVGLSYMMGTFVDNYRYIAAGSVLAVIPVVILFVFSQKYLVRGIYSGSVK